LESGVEREEGEPTYGRDEAGVDAIRVLSYRQGDGKALSR
jgi:hypothetical protein